MDSRGFGTGRLMKRCLYCQKKLSLMMRLQGEGFCTPEHESAFQAKLHQATTRGSSVVLDASSSPFEFGAKSAPRLTVFKSPSPLETGTASPANPAKPGLFTVPPQPQRRWIPKVRISVKLSLPQWKASIRPQAPMEPLHAQNPTPSRRRYGMF